MKLLVIAGFLGSGKTTLLLTIARSLARRSSGKIAVIENEVGKVGIDDHYLSGEGLQVREIYSGCICCSLRLDLINTLLELERQFNPEVVILEPSGVAGPRQVLQSISGYGGEIEQKQVLALIDAVRFQEIHDFSIPLIADGINVADIVVVNKIDQVDDQDLAELKNRVSQIKHDAWVLPVSALNHTNMDRLLDAILPMRHQPESQLTSQDDLEDVAVDKSLLPKATVHAREIDLSFAEPVSSDHIQQNLSTFLSKLSESLKQQGCSLIGHLKAIVRANKSGYLLASTTSFDQPPHIKGKLARTISNAKLTVNAIVYDVENEMLEQLVGRHLQELVAVKRQER